MLPAAAVLPGLSQTASVGSSMTPLKVWTLAFCCQRQLKLLKSKGLLTLKLLMILQSKDLRHLTECATQEKGQ